MAAPKRTSTPDEQIADNPSIDACVKECFQHFHTDDVRQYLKKFQTQPHDQDQALHTFRELLFGSYLARNGWRVRGEYKIDGQTPDWSFFGDGEDPTGIIDVVNLHADKSTDERTKRLLNEGKTIDLSGDEDAISKRVYDSIKRKCGTYKAIVESRKIPYVIGLFPQFSMPVNQSHVLENLYLPPTGLFLAEELGGYPNVSGLAFLSEPSPSVFDDALWMRYRFDYFPNPYALHPWEFPSGVYWYPRLLERRSKYLQMIADLKAEKQFYSLLMQIFLLRGVADVYGRLLVTLQSLMPEQTAPPQDQRGS